MEEQDTIFKSRLLWRGTRQLRQVGGFEKWEKDNLNNLEACFFFKWNETISTKKRLFVKRNKTIEISWRFLYR